ncbi:hypothetical protein GMB86_00660 [Terrilactibacillus sp. BCM23-1]|uniref:DUF948 domain-containing protein n=1 Tax=Terrilactibacillus tamarindi TaxID=2599694 RepID=A0A6N8CL10_9BACI|nr:hypothetical protein [Terrilactibacillus tamarindi]MTT30524.1 hypothetical protein [Terrilactibacillus tamarindi]
MIIVYLSLALVVIAIILFVISAIRTGKKLKGTLADASKITEKVRERTEEIAKEKVVLNKNLDKIQQDVANKKYMVQSTIIEAKKSANDVKNKLKDVVRIHD